MKFDKIQEEIKLFEEICESGLDISLEEETNSLILGQGNIKITLDEIQGINPVTLSNKYKIDAMLIELINGAILFKNDNSFSLILDSEHSYTKSPLPIVELEGFNDF